MNEAKICSKLSPYHRYKIGSVLHLKNGKKYYAYNCDKSHPLQGIFSNLQHHLEPSKRKKVQINNYLHAEIYAITLALRENSYKDLHNSTIYVYRTPNNGNEFAMCRPCSTCYSALRYFKISKMFYTSNESDFVMENVT